MVEILARTRRGAEIAVDVERVERRGPDFVVTPKGEVIPIPKGATGPVLAENGKGYRYTGGSGGNGLDVRVSDVRIMAPTPPRGASPGYPGGYVSYGNTRGQTVHPQTGLPIARNDLFWHIPLTP